MSESTDGQARSPASASSPSVHPPAPTSVQITQQIREAITDTAGIVLAGYLVSRGAIGGVHALYFALALLLPSPVLVRLAKVLGSRTTSAGTGAAMALLGAAALYTKLKGALVLGAGVLGLAACLGGCSGAQVPHLSPIAPRVVADPLYGTCIEVGGKLTVGEIALAQLSRTCLLLDGGAGPMPDASEPESEPIPDKSDAGVTE